VCRSPQENQDTTLSQLDAIRTAVHAEQKSYDARLKQASDRNEALKKEIDAKNAELAVALNKLAGQKRMFDHFGGAVGQETIKRAKEALELLHQVGGVASIKVLKAERDRKEAADKAAADKAAADKAAAAQAAARAAAQATARSNHMTAEDERTAYDAMLATSGFKVGQLCCVGWTRKMSSLVKIVGVPNCDFVDHIQARVVVNFGQPAYVHFSVADARRYLEALTRDNIVAVQKKIFHPDNLKLLYSEDSQTLERLKSSVPGFVQYTSQVRSQTRDVIAKHPNFADCVELYNGKRPTAAGTNYKVVNPTAAALMQLQGFSTEASSSDTQEQPEQPDTGIQEIEDQDGDDECRAVGVRTTEERNRIGFANAIVLE
tara:strand:- start:131 stop:1255 length:1125 start_codon:yes stop_codon:yes gene_type:complete